MKVLTTMQDTVPFGQLEFTLLDEVQAMVQPLVGWVYEVTTSTDWVEKEKVKKKREKKQRIYSEKQIYKSTLKLSPKSLS